MPTEEVDRYYFIEHSYTDRDDWYRGASEQFDTLKRAMQVMNVTRHPEFKFRIIERVVTDTVILTEGESNGRDSQSESN